MFKVLKNYLWPGQNGALREIIVFGVLKLLMKQQIGSLTTRYFNVGIEVRGELKAHAQQNMCKRFETTIRKYYGARPVNRHDSLPIVQTQHLSPRRIKMTYFKIVILQQYFTHSSKKCQCEHHFSKMSM